MNGYISNAIAEDEDNYDETVYAAINKVKFEMTYRNLISQSFPEMIDFEIELYSKAYMYDYNALNYGTYFENKGNFSFFFSKIYNYLKKNGYKDLPLKNKCLLAMAWNPAKFLKNEYSNGIKDYDLNFIDRCKDYDYILLKNMNIVYANAGGNHRLLLQALQNNDIKATVTEYDDTELLKKFKTDGGYLINIIAPAEKIPVPDYRFAVIFKLTQLKLQVNSANNCQNIAR